MNAHLARALALVFFVTTTALHAQVSQLLNYQGRVAVGGVNFSGSGQFKFALVDTTGANTFWSNDGTSTAGSQPTAAVTLTVTNGLYSVLLGDALANMTAVPASVFLNSDVRLRVWFNDGSHGFQLLAPDQRIAAVGYAIMAAGVSLPATTGATVGVITQNGGPFLYSFGTNNFFAGAGAGNFTMTGVGNTASGRSALQSNTMGNYNTASGRNALFSNTTGSYNTASGFNALESITSGSSNIAIGGDAGINLVTGSNNIDIGNAGVADESNIIRVGDGATQTDTFLTGTIHGNGSGLTGIAASSLAAGSVTSTQIAAGAVGSAQLATGLTLGGTTTGTFSGGLTGNVTGSAASFTGSLAGNVTGTQGATIVATVGGVTAANVASGANLANAATNANTASTIVKRDASGNFTAGTVTATSAATATTAGSFTGSLAGDVTGTQGAAVVANVGTSTATNVHAAELLANAATNANTPGTIVKRDASGNFSAGTVTATAFAGDGSGLTGISGTTRAPYNAQSVALLKWGILSINNTFSVGTNPKAICFDGSSIWVTNQCGNSATKL